jgi:uncharacterized protein YaiE (UPF0345 family)
MPEALQWGLTIDSHRGFFYHPAPKKGAIMSSPERFENVTAVCKANVYFDGKVISHSILFDDGTKKTLGLMFSGSYTFSTGAPERMEIISGACRVKLPGQSGWTSYAAGTYFDAPGNAAFDIAIDDGIVQYVCSYL